MLAECTNQVISGSKQINNAYKSSNTLVAVQFMWAVFCADSKSATVFCEGNMINRVPQVDQNSSDCSSYASLSPDTIESLET